MVLAFGNPAALNILNEIDELKQLSRLISFHHFPFYVIMVGKPDFQEILNKNRIVVVVLFPPKIKISAYLFKSYKQEQHML